MGPVGLSARVAIPDNIPGLGPRGDRPRLNPAADLGALRLTPVEGFVLSRVDGTSSYEQICMVTGIGADATLSILRRLRQEGLIIGPVEGGPAPPSAAPWTPPRASATPVVGVPVTPPKAAGPPPPAKTPTGEPQVLHPPPQPLLERLDDGSPVDPADMVAGTDLPPELKMRIIRLHRRLKKLGPYEMLGLPAGADRGAVKRAYFAASKELHPDRYYGKDLGPFREMLGDIFARLTDVFQALEQKK